MIDMADRLRAHSLRVGILSDQTNWLDDLNERDRIFPHYDAVFNSFYLGKGKRDAGLFDDIATRLHADPASILFIDDNPGHCERARQKHYQVIHFTDIDSFCGTMATFFPAL
jgi:putative hydrolase of the HAD superfamily